MMLIDAGPILALLDRDDAEHEACLRTATSIDDTLCTTWPALSEAVHLLLKRLGKRKFPQARDAIFNLIETGQLLPLDLTPDEVRLSGAFMRKYADLPMDLADATLVALAESRGMSMIFTLDRHFRIYRIHGRKSLRILPSLPR